MLLFEFSREKSAWFGYYPPVWPWFLYYTKICLYNGFKLQAFQPHFKQWNGEKVYKSCPQTIFKRVVLFTTQTHAVRVEKQYYVYVNTLLKVNNILFLFYKMSFANPFWSLYWQSTKIIVYDYEDCTDKHMFEKINENYS